MGKIMFMGQEYTAGGGVGFISAPKLTADKSVPAGESATTIQSITLPAGKWLLEWGIRFTGTTSAGQIVYTFLDTGGSHVLSVAVNAPSVGGYIRANANWSTVVEPNTTTTYSTAMACGVATSVSAPLTYLIALKVG